MEWPASNMPCVPNGCLTHVHRSHVDAAKSLLQDSQHSITLRGNLNECCPVVLGDVAWGEGHADVEHSFTATGDIAGAARVDCEVETEDAAS